MTTASKITLVFFILMFAYGVAECFMATGVGAALIAFLLVLLVSCIFSFSQKSSLTVWMMYLKICNGISDRTST